MRIEVRDRRKSAALRDYFRRLEATAVGCGDGTLDGEPVKGSDVR